MNINNINIHERDEIPVIRGLSKGYQRVIRGYSEGYRGIIRMNIRIIRGYQRVIRAVPLSKCFSGNHERVTRVILSDCCNLAAELNDLWCL